jgi:hypothetical protein
MYVTIRRYTGVQFPESAAAKVREEFCPIISKIPGFVEYFAIRDGDDSVISVSVFDSKPGADESLRAAAKWVPENLGDYLPNPPEVMGGDTLAHTAPSERKSA